MTKDGLGIVLALLFVALFFTTIAVVLSSLTGKIFAIFTWLFLVFGLFFFRDPERRIPEAENIIVSAADGKVVDIVEIQENHYLQQSARQISIFLSVFDVHINRIPMSGTVGFFKYQKGKFHQAFRKIASTRNEQTIIGIEKKDHKILIKQIAGILARRIVCHIREGYNVEKGKRFGMIKFGSRVDMILPLHYEICVKLGDKVKGGETIIARIKEK